MKYEVKYLYYVFVIVLSEMTIINDFASKKIFDDKIVFLVSFIEPEKPNIYKSNKYSNDILFEYSLIFSERKIFSKRIKNY